MKRRWFNSIVFKKALESGYGINKCVNDLGPIENENTSENTSKSEDENIKAKNIHSWRGGDNPNPSWRGCSNSSKDIQNLISDDTFLVRDRDGDSYSISFDIENENHILELKINNTLSFLSELESSYYSYLNSYLNDGSTSENPYLDRYMCDTQYWINHINSCIDRYLQTQISIISMDRSSVSDSNYFTLREDLEGTQKYKHLWVVCEECYGFNYKQFFKSKQNICEYCGYHLKMSSSDRIELSIDPGTWHPMDEDLFSVDPDPIGWDDSEEEEPDQDRIEEEEPHPDPIGSDDSEEEEPDQDRIEEEPDQDRIEEEYILIIPIELIEEEPDQDRIEEEPDQDRIEEEPDQDRIGWDEDLFSVDPDPIGWDDSEEPDQDRIEEEPDQDRIEEEPDQDPIGWDEDLFSVDPDPIGWDDSEEEPDPIGWDDSEEPHPDPIGWDDSEEPDQDRIEEEPDQDRIEEEEEEEEEPYKDRIDSYQRETGLTEAVQTGIGQINGIPIAFGVMDFQFMGGSMGSVVGEKITRLIEYATNQFLPLIIVCASGGARMQEGSLSLMQMAKISSALYDYKSNKKSFYVSILTSPTTGGVTASFGMLGDIIIAEPNAYIAFAGKRVIEETLHITLPEGSQEAENLFDKGSFDLIVPRTSLKSVLSELFKLHAFFPLN
uniref:Acetyl-coenzyme A carboxylase carboxyl transferase subunit beta, chloroplastic n=1 Tax=Syringa pubescens subsp. microphylla TaxID=150406 RepID=A0A4D5Y2R7_9LAMI|nr:acetyl-CoA carboxylase subunit [Syringa julianae]ANA08903.1 acetyl-CoA carboxylase subunit [Syringa pubescens subsp. microphylla]QBS50093.1 acetyl-CoA carboxylase beta subunit [Syringa pubescens subsp. microphylla]